MENLSVVSKLFLALHCRQSIRHFNSFLKFKISALFQQDFGFAVYAICPLFQFFCQMKNVTVVSTIFWPSIAGNLSVVSIFSQMENLTVVSRNSWLFIVGSLPSFQFLSQMEN